MLIYVKYFLTWLLFMALIAGITLLVPKLAPKIDKWRAEKKAKMKREEELISTQEEEASQQAQTDGVSVEDAEK